MQFGLQQFVLNPTVVYNIFDIVFTSIAMMLNLTSMSPPVVNCDHCIVRFNTSISSHKLTVSPDNNSVLWFDFKKKLITLK